MPSSSPSVADRLLDAQVAWVVGELTGDRLLAVLARDVDDLLAMAADVRLQDVMTPGAVVAVLDVALARVPASDVAGAMVAATAKQLHEGPDTPVRPGDLFDRAQVAEVFDAGVKLRPLAKDVMDRLVDSPKVGNLASGFVTRLVVDVLEANKSMAKKIPGVGSLVSFGTSAATKVVGVADKQVQSLLGDSANKGTAMAVRRLNSVIMSTLEDPVLRDAVLEVWDTHADSEINGVEDVVDGADVIRFAQALHGLVVAGATSPPVHEFLDAWVHAFFDLHGEQTMAEVIAGLGIGSDDLLLFAIATIPPVVEAALASGHVESMVRARLAPFYNSPEVAAILGGAKA